MRRQLERALRLWPRTEYLYFKADGSANVDTRRASRRSPSCCGTLQYHGPGSLEKDWIAQYKPMGGGNGFMGASFPNLTKILPGNPDLDTADVGKYIRSASCRAATSAARSSAGR